MADQETEQSLPVDVTVQTTVPASYGQLQQNVVDFGRKSYESVNAIPAPKIPSQATIELPQLTESKQTGYTNGVSKQITCCAVGAHLVEKNAAYDFVLMSNAAAKDGVTLKINSAFRTNEEQTQYFNERQNPAVAAVKGVAAKPGYSNHQSGIAIDINVGMSKSDYIAKRYSPTYLWLTKFAGEFGYDHEEGASVNEPWHWTHKPTSIVGTTAFQSATGLTVATVDTAVDAAASGQSGTLRLTNLEAHDNTVALARAAIFAKTPRQTIMKERAISSANSSNYLNALVSQLQTSKLTVEQDPKPFDTSTINPLVYNFATGKWGDDKPV